MIKKIQSLEEGTQILILETEETWGQICIEAKKYILENFNTNGEMVEDFTIYYK